MTDDIQQLIDIIDLKSAFEYLRNMRESSMRLIACRMMHKGEKDNKYISQITLCRQEEIEGLRDNLSLDQAMLELGLSEKSLKKYIRQGLTVHNGKIPRFALEIMKLDAPYFILMQKDYQEEKLKTQTQEDYLLEIRERITEFEEEFGGKFEELFGHLTDGEIDAMDDYMNLMIWKDLIEELQEIGRKRGLS